MSSCQVPSNVYEPLSAAVCPSNQHGTSHRMAPDQESKPWIRTTMGLLRSAFGVFVRVASGTTRSGAAAQAQRPQSTPVAQITAAVAAAARNGLLWLQSDSKRSKRGKRVIKREALLLRSALAEAEPEQTWRDCRCLETPRQANVVSEDRGTDSCIAQRTGGNGNVLVKYPVLLPL